MKTIRFKLETFLPIIVFIFLNIILVFIWQFLKDQKTKDVSLKTELVASQIQSHFEDRFDSHIEIIKLIRREWLDNKIQNEAEFQEMVLPLTKTFSGFQALNFIDSTGVIRWVCPEENNPNVKDKDLHNHPFAASTFIRAEQTGQDCVTPVLELWQSGIGFATYFPITYHGRRLGYLNGVFKIREFILYIYQEGILKNFAMHLEEDGKDVFAFSEDIENGDQTVVAKRDVAIMDRTLTMKLSPNRGLVNASQSLLNKIFELLSIFLAGVFAFMIHVLIKKQRILHESELLYRRLFDASNDAIATIHPPEWNLTSVNHAFESMFKIQDKLPLHNIGLWALSPKTQLGHESSQKALLDKIKVALDRGYEFIEWSFQRMDQSIFPATILLNKVDLESGAFIQATIRDITDQKKKEAVQSVLYGISQAVNTTSNLNELFQAIHQQLSHVIDTTNFFIALLDEENNRLVFPYYIDELDPPPQPVDLPSMTLTEYSIRTGKSLFLKKDEVREMVQRGLINSEYLGTEAIVWLGTPLKYQDKIIGVIVVQSYHDPNIYADEDLEILKFVSEQIAAAITYKQSEFEQSQLQNQLNQSQKMESVGRLAGGVAHDFNNMLAVILGHTELALEKVDDNVPMRKHLEEILAASTRSAEVTRQLLAFARKQTIIPKIIDLNETIGNLLSMLRRLIGEDVELLWYPQSDLWPVKIDPSQIDQILTNVCVNARDAINGVGKITVKTATTSFDEAFCAKHEGFSEGDYVMLEVGDDGKGMDSETLAHIFEPFFTTKGLGQGTGLGLATIYGIIKQNDGFITVDSEPDQGTIFKIYFPRFIGQVAKNIRLVVEATPPGHGETILLVEDEVSILEMAKEILTDLGYSVLAASSPGKALNIARNHTGKIHMLITDVVMPKQNGRDLALAIRDLFPGVKILFMSGYTAEVIADRGVLDEGISFVQKPFTKRDFARQVQKILSS